jgi:hypothetical protein
VESHKRRCISGRAAEHLETFLASLNADPDAKGLPAYVERELYDYVQLRDDP